MRNENQAKKILISAFQCISSKGYANVSLRDIAEHAGVVLSQLNYYYKNKEGLFTEVIKALSNKYLTEIEEVLKKGNSSKERLSQVISYFDNILREHPELFKVLYEITGMALWSSVFRDLIQTLYKNLSNLIEKYIIATYIDEKKLVNCSSEALSRMILGTLVGTATQIILNPGKDITDSLNALESVLD